MPQHVGPVLILWMLETISVHSYPSCHTLLVVLSKRKHIGIASYLCRRQIPDAVHIKGLFIHASEPKFPASSPPASRSLPKAYCMKAVSPQRICALAIPPIVIIRFSSMHHKNPAQSVNLIIAHWHAIVNAPLLHATPSFQNLILPCARRDALKNYAGSIV